MTKLFEWTGQRRKFIDLVATDLNNRISEDQGAERVTDIFFEVNLNEKGIFCQIAIPKVGEDTVLPSRTDLMPSVCFQELDVSFELVNYFGFCLVQGNAGSQA